MANGPNQNNAFNRPYNNVTVDAYVPTLFVTPITDFVVYVILVCHSV